MGMYGWRLIWLFTLTAGFHFRLSSTPFKMTGIGSMVISVDRNGMLVLSSVCLWEL